MDKDKVIVSRSNIYFQ